MSTKPAERPWQPWERNFSGGRIGVQEQQGENENWMVLHVESGIGKTTTSLRLNEAWDLALMVSPAVKARLFELLAARRRAENALHQFSWADTLAPLLRKVAEDWDCDSSVCELASDDMGGLSCPNMDREGCRAVEAGELRQFADALEFAAVIREQPQIAASEMPTPGLTDDVVKELVEALEVLREAQIRAAGDHDDSYAYGVLDTAVTEFLAKARTGVTLNG